VKGEKRPSPFCRWDDNAFVFGYRLIYFTNWPMASKIVIILPINHSATSKFSSREKRNPTKTLSL
jgi:hypothetical protein